MEAVLSQEEPPGCVCITTDDSDWRQTKEPNIKSFLLMADHRWSVNGPPHAISEMCQEGRASNSEITHCSTLSRWVRPLHALKLADLECASMLTLFQVQHHQTVNQKLQSQLIKHAQGPCSISLLYSVGRPLEVK